MPTFVRKTAIACDLMFPQVARHAPAQFFKVTPVGPAHMLPIVAGTVAVIADANGDEKRQPVLEYRAQLFERTSQNGQHEDWCVTARPIGADGAAVRYDRLEMPDGATAYLEMLLGDDRDELVRQALAGGLLVVIDDNDTVDTLDPDDDSYSQDVDEFRHARAAGASFTQDE